jgi:hypothetical protein
MKLWLSLSPMSPHLRKGNSNATKMKAHLARLPYHVLFYYHDMYRRQFQEDLDKKVRDKRSKVRDKRSTVIEEEGTFKRREVGVAKVIEHSISNDIRIMPNKNNHNFFLIHHHHLKATGGPLLPSVKDHGQ